jgi:hypothetical protein
VKRPHVECGFKLTRGSKRLLLLMYEGGERGTIVPHGLHTIADAIVPDGWHTQLLLLWLDLQLQASSCPRPLSGTINNTSCSFSCLQSVADDNNDVNITKPYHNQYSRLNKHFLVSTAAHSPKLNPRKYTHSPTGLWAVLLAFPTRALCFQPLHTHILATWKGIHLESSKVF